MSRIAHPISIFLVLRSSSQSDQINVLLLLLKCTDFTRLLFGKLLKIDPVIVEDVRSPEITW